MFFYLTTDYDVLWFPSPLKVILRLTENNTKYSNGEIKYNMASYAKVRTTRDHRVIEGLINFNAIHWISHYVVDSTVHFVTLVCWMVIYLDSAIHPSNKRAQANAVALVTAGLTFCKAPCYWRSAKSWNWILYNLKHKQKQLNPLTSERDWPLDSPYNINPESLVKLTRIKEMISNQRISWLLNNFFLVAL